MRWRADFLSAWAEALLRKAGADEPSAKAVAWALVEADLRGVGSHGLLRLPVYLRRLEAGLVNSRPTLPVEERGPVALLDGEHGFGPRVALKAVEAAQSLARRHGLGAVGVRRSTHFGMAGLYAEKLAQAGFLALVTTNAEPDVVLRGAGEGLGHQPSGFRRPGPSRDPRGRPGHLGKRHGQGLPSPGEGGEDPPAGGWTGRGTPPRTPAGSTP